MDDTRATILTILAKQRLKPGELAEKLGISRQALHRHLRVLVEENRIQKYGIGPHVVYIATPDLETSTRVQEDYVLFRQEILPRYMDDFADIFEGYRQHLRKQEGVEESHDFGFLLDSAAVYSSNIEGNTLDLNSFLNSRMSPRKYRPKEAQEIEDLVSAYEYAKTHDLCEKNMLHAHKILSREFVAASRQGVYRQEPVGVFSQQGLEYMAVEAHFVLHEMRAVFTIMSELLSAKHSALEYFFWASWLHLMIALIHPFSDGNGRTARLCEKWFLAVALGEKSFGLPSEECYWKNRSLYYAGLKLGANYWEADMKKSFSYFRLLPEALFKTLQSRRST